MNVLVTGGCGFVGSNTCKHFAEQGHEVIAYDNMDFLELSRSGYSKDIKRMVRNYLEQIGVQVVGGDILNKTQLEHYGSNVDFIIHTAAQPAMTIAKEYPGKDFNTNVRGTFNLLELAYIYDIPIVNCSSIHVYGNGINNQLQEQSTRYERRPSTISENHPVLTGDISPLHASKRSAEIYTEAFIQTYGLKAANFRLTGMYGPGQLAGMDHGWVANFAIRTLMKKPITIFDTDKQVRDILYISDVIKAFEAFYDKQVPGTYNVGGGLKTAISLKESLDLIHDITGLDQDIRFDESRKGDLYYFVCNIDKIKQNLGWEPNVLPKEGIGTMIEWMTGNKWLFGGVK